MSHFLLMFFLVEFEVHFVFFLSGQGLLKLIFDAFYLFDKMAVFFGSQLYLMLSLSDSVFAFECLVDCLLFLQFKFVQL
jgi:hypothetical protein